MRIGILVILGLGTLGATTLQHLSLDHMIQESTSIVSGKVTGSTTVMRGSMVFTKYHVRVTEQWKGNSGSETDVFVPGGKVGSITQTYPGSPRLGEGQDYMLFLWTSRTGLTQVIGLSQGLFTMMKDPKGEFLLVRSASGETMVDSSGKVVEETPVSMRMREMVDRIQRRLAGVRQ